MNRRFLIGALLGVPLAASASPQDTAVAELSREDSTKAAELYKQLKVAELAWTDFMAQVRRQYGPVVAKSLPPARRASVMGEGGHELFELPSEWGGGIKFSTDFKFVLPR